MCIVIGQDLETWFTGVFKGAFGIRTVDESDSDEVVDSGKSFARLELDCQGGRGDSNDRARTIGPKTIDTDQLALRLLHRNVER